VTRRKDKKTDDLERMSAAMQRLEELLQNPGPGITVTPVADRFPRDGEARDVFEAEDAVQAEIDAALAAATRSPAAEPPTPVAQATAAPHPAQKTSPVKIEAKTSAPVWTKKIGGGPETPPKREPTPEPPKTKAVPKAQKVFRPPSTSGGMFGVFLTWMLGPRDSEVKDAVFASRRALNATFIFSAVINILMMAGPLFMLQVYDRVLSSGSFPTLMALSAITAGLYGIIGMLELARSRIIGRVGAEIDQRLSDRIFEAALRKSLATQGAAGPALRDYLFRYAVDARLSVRYFLDPLDAGNRGHYRHFHSARPRLA
jgi:hypothetical protein